MSTESTDVPEIDIEELAEHLTGDPPPFVLDVREPDEFSEARIAGVVHVPLATVPERIADLPTDQPVFVVCAAGGRSMQAAAFLRPHGIDAINVAGGTKAWVASGKPFDSDLG